MSHYFSFASFLDSELLPSKVTFLLHVGKRGQHERCEYQHVYFFAQDCRPPPHRFCRLGAKFAKLALRHLINPDGRKSLWPRSFRINFGALRASSLTQKFHAFFCSLFESFVPCLVNPMLWSRFHMHFPEATVRDLWSCSPFFCISSVVAHQVDLLIEAYYDLDEKVKGEFLGMQMSKVGVFLHILRHANSRA